MPEPAITIDRAKQYMREWPGRGSRESREQESREASATELAGSAPMEDQADAAVGTALSAQKVAGG